MFEHKPRHFVGRMFLWRPRGQATNIPCKLLDVFENEKGKPMASIQVVIGRAPHPKTTIPLTPKVREQIILSNISEQKPEKNYEII